MKPFNYLYEQLSYTHAQWKEKQTCDILQRFIYEQPITFDMHQ